MTIEEKLEHIEAMLKQLVERQAVKEFYEIEEFARIVGRSEFTCREWCRLGRIAASKKASGRGKHMAWVVSHHELIRYQREGLLPAAGAKSESCEMNVSMPIISNHARTARELRDASGIGGFSS
jgi:hypothetical protein